MIRTMQVVNARDAQQELEAHEKLGNKVIEALRGDDGKAETGPRASRTSTPSTSPA